MKQVTIINKVIPAESRSKYGTSGRSSVISGGASVDLSPYLLKAIWERNFEERKDEAGNEYIYIKKPIVGAAGMTLFAGDEIKVDSIFKGLPIDTETLQWVDGVLTVVGGGTGGGASNWDELEGKPSWITNTKPIYTWSEITNKPNTLYDYGIQASDILNTIKSVDGSGSGLDADTLDGIHANRLFTSLESDTTTNLSITIGGTTKSITDLCANSAARLQTARTIWGQSFDGTANVTGSLTSVTNITGTGTFTGANIKATDSVYVNGIRLHKTVDGAVTIEGNLLVTGGITAYADGTDSGGTGGGVIVIDNLTSTLTDAALSANQGRILKGLIDSKVSNWGELEGKPTTIAGYGISASDVLETLKTVDGSGSGLDADTLDGVHNGFVSGRLHTYGLPYTDNDKKNYWVKIATLKLTSQYSSQEAILLISERYTLTSNSYYAFVSVRIQQQNSMGNIPNVSLKAFGSISNSNIVGILNYNSSSSTLDVYYREVNVYQRGYVSYVQGTADIRTNSQELIATLPSGTQIISTNDCRCGYSNNADMLDNVHLNGIFTAFTTNGNNTRLTIGGVTKDLTVPYASNADMLDGYHLKYNWITGNVAYIKLATIKILNAYANTPVEFRIKGRSGGDALICVRFDNYNGTDPELISFTGYGIYSGYIDRLKIYKSATSTWEIWLTSQTQSYDSGQIYAVYVSGDFSFTVNGSTSTTLPIYSTSYTCSKASIYGNIAGNSSTATKLQTARTIWGQSFNGTANVSGNMTGVGSISASGSISCGSLRTTDISGNGSSLYIGNSNNSSYVYLREDMKSSNGNWSIPVNGDATFASATINGALTVPYSRGQWISMATRSNVIQADQNQSQTSAHALFRVKSYNGNAVCFGGLNDEVGFYGFYKSRIDSGSNDKDWYTKWDTSNGTLTHKGNLLVTGGGTFYSSDIRAKTITERPKLSLNSIANAPVIKFKWNGYNGLKDDNKLHVGGIAQYIEKILPECVIGQKDDFLSFDYATTGYIFSVLTARHLLSYETRTDRIIRKLKERIKRLEKQLNIENHEEVCIVAD